MKTNSKFTIDGVTYFVDNFQAIHQVNIRPFVYDKKYVSTYDTPQYRKQSEMLQALRLGFVIGAVGYTPRKIVDVGYGNGDFLRMAKNVTDVYGSDISGVKIDGIDTGSSYPEAEVYTFWDCLEHIPDLSFLFDLPAEFVCVSLPYCKAIEEGIEWFANWKHRKPDEHLHHFNTHSLSYTMNEYGWSTLVAKSHHEDIVRKPAGDGPNILTMAFSR